MKAKNLFTLLILALCCFCVTSCSDDDEDEKNPITLKDRDGSSIMLYYQGSSEAYSFPIQGGDGQYSVTCDKTGVVEAEMISDIDMQVTILKPGKATITIKDNSKNTLNVDVSVDYETRKFVVIKHYVNIEGELTVNERTDIMAKALATIPVKENGGYEFIFNNIEKDYSGGKAIIFPDTYGKNGLETTFEYRPIESNISYEIIIEGQKRTFILGYYDNSTRTSVSPHIMFNEDIKEQFKEENYYSKLEKVSTSQEMVIRIK